MPYRYTDIQYTDMVMCYAASGCILDAARDMYRQMHRFEPVPARGTILGAVQRLRDFGVFRRPNVDAGRPRGDARLEEEIIEYFDDNPMASTNDAAQQFGVSQYFAWQLVRESGKHPYHFRRVQELLTTDFTPRLEFCNWLVEEPRNILWTDESTFSRVGIFNQHNAHWWASENPHVTMADHFQHRFSVNVWAGLLNNVVLGPVFLQRLNGASYLSMLQDDVEQLLEEVPLRNVVNLFYQHDGAPAHYCRAVREYLDRTYPGRWVGRAGPVAWPARSPDLTPMDFYVWGRVKDLVYQNQMDTIRSADELKTRIISAFDAIRSDQSAVRNVQEDIFRRANLCIQQNGMHLEHLM